MRLGVSYVTSIDLPGASITSKQVSKKLTIYPYLFTDSNAVLESGLGPCTLTVPGVCTSAAERDAVEAQCEAKGIKMLFFPSEIGQTDDRYYKVYTQPAKMAPQHNSNPTRWSYEIECISADQTVYVKATDLAVW